MTGTATGFLPVLLIGELDDVIQLTEEHLFLTAEGVVEGLPKARRWVN